MKGRVADDVVRHADLLFARPDREFGARAIVRLGTAPCDRGVHARRPQERSDDRRRRPGGLEDRAGGPAYRARLNRDAAPRAGGAADLHRGSE